MNERSGSAVAPARRDALRLAPASASASGSSGPSPVGGVHVGRSDFGMSDEPVTAELPSVALDQPRRSASASNATICGCVGVFFAGFFVAILPLEPDPDFLPSSVFESNWLITAW